MSKNNGSYTTGAINSQQKDYSSPKGALNMEQRRNSDQKMHSDNFNFMGSATMNFKSMVNIPEEMEDDRASQGSSVRPINMNETLRIGASRNSSKRNTVTSRDVIEYSPANINKDITSNNQVNTYHSEEIRVDKFLGTSSLENDSTFKAYTQHINPLPPIKESLAQEYSNSTSKQQSNLTNISTLEKNI